MTVSVDTNRVSYSGAGTTGPFAFTFSIFQDEDLVVKKRNDATGTETPLTLTTDFTVSVADYPGPGNVTTVDAVEVGETIVIVRELDLTQEVDFIEGNATPQDDYEVPLDRLTMIAQQLKETIDRCLKLPVSTQYGGSGAELTDLLSGSSRYLASKPDGTGVMWADVISVIAASALMKNVVASETSDLARHYLEANRYYVDATETDQGAAGSGRSLKDIIDAVGTSKKATIIFSHSGTGTTTTYTLSTDETVPSNFTLQFEAGAIISVDSGKTLTLYSPQSILAPPVMQIFSGLGSVEFTVSGEIWAGWFGFSDSASAATNAAAIMSALTSAPADKGITVKLHGGVFSVSADTVTFADLESCHLKGVSPAYGYETSPEVATVLSFGSGTVGLNLYASDAATNHNKISDLAIIGNSNLANGIKVANGQIIEDVYVTSCTAAGIWFANRINQTVLNRVALVNNTGGTGYGLFIENGATNSTIFNINNCNIRQNTVGIRMETGQHASFRGCVVESNISYGLDIYKPTGKMLLNITFDSCWFENNNDASNSYQVRINSQTQDYTSGPPMGIDFYNCKFNALASQKGIDIDSAMYARFFSCRGSGDVDLAAYASYTTFYDWFGGTINDSGNRTVQISTKTNGSAGFAVAGDILKTGGRTVILWYISTQAMTAGNTYYATPLPAIDATLAAQVDSYPVPAGGSLVGIVISKENSIDAGTLTFTVNRRNAWMGSRIDMGVSTDMTNSDGRYKSDTYTQEGATFYGNGNYSLEVQIAADGSFADTGNEYMMIGLIIEF